MTRAGGSRVNIIISPSMFTGSTGVVVVGRVMLLQLHIIETPWEISIWIVWCFYVPCGSPSPFPRTQNIDAFFFCRPHSIPLGRYTTAYRTHVYFYFILREDNGLHRNVFVWGPNICLRTVINRFVFWRLNTLVVRRTVKSQNVFRVRFGKWITRNRLKQFSIIRKGEKRSKTSDDCCLHQYINYKDVVGV